MSETAAISKEVQVLEDIRKYFEFLFERGYVIYSKQIFSVEFDAWEVVLKNQDFFIKFEEEKGGLDLSFGSPSKGFMRIRALIYYLSKERKFIGLGSGCISFLRNHMETEAKLLQQYIDKFEASFGGEFPSTIEEAKLAEDRYYRKITG